MHISRKEFGDPTSKFNHIYLISYRDYVKFIITLTTLCSCLQLVTEVKQKRKDDLLFSCCSKCNTLLVKTLKPHLEKTNEILTRSLKTQYMTRDALLAKLTEIRKENQNLELAMKRQKEPLMVMVIMRNLVEAMK